jgi:hypothetical protein
LGLAFQLLLAERRQGDAEKADAFCDREQWLEQRVANLLDFGSRRKERLTGPASRAPNSWFRPRSCKNVNSNQATGLELSLET